VNGPSWYSQPFPPEGASAAEGIRSQLGSPKLDLLTILVRESAQNSWDARLPAGPVDFAIDIRVIDQEKVAEWRDLLGRNAPLDDHLPLCNALSRASVRIMIISDRGTRGLGGPTRADDAVGMDRDFVSFVRNIGEPRDTEFGGGTYGFGKGIFYLISKAGTVLIHTRCQVEGGFDTRLIGCALWKSYVTSGPEGEKRYTGRHWWGDTSGEVIEPLVGGEAEATARLLGLDPFGPEETGTSVIVIDPLLEDTQPAEAASYLADTIMWHLWPKMLETSTDLPAMRFSVTYDGVEYPVPDPRETRPLDMFVAAHRRLKSGEAKMLECRNPKKALGRLCLEKRVAPALVPNRAALMAGIETIVHHVCLLRVPELVVTYHQGPKPPSEYTSYAGVFLADQALDDTYAMAEPPTHDAWNHQSLEYPESTFVRTTFRRIKDSLDGLLELAGGARPGSSHIALGAASSRFSSLVGGARGMGGDTDYGRPGDARPTPRPGDPEPAESFPGGRGTNGAETYNSSSGDSNENPPKSGELSVSPRSARRRLRVEYVGEPYLAERSGGAVIVQQFRLPVSGPQRLSVDLAVAVTDAGGRETDPPLGADMPCLLGWESTTDTLSMDESPIVEGGNGAIWRVIVRPAPDTMTEITIVAQPVVTAS
jgi:hypothetical protein